MKIMLYVGFVVLSCLFLPGCGGLGAGGSQVVISTKTVICPPDMVRVECKEWPVEIEEGVISLAGYKEFVEGIRKNYSSCYQASHLWGENWRSCVEKFNSINQSDR